MSLLEPRLLNIPLHYKTQTFKECTLQVEVGCYRTDPKQLPDLQLHPNCEPFYVLQRYYNRPRTDSGVYVIGVRTQHWQQQVANLNLSDADTAHLSFYNVASRLHNFLSEHLGHLAPFYIDELFPRDHQYFHESITRIGEKYKRTAFTTHEREHIGLARIIPIQILLLLQTALDHAHSVNIDFAFTLHQLMQTISTERELALQRAVAICQDADTTIDHVSICALVGTTQVQRMATVLHGCVQRQLESLIATQEVVNKQAELIGVLKRSHLDLRTRVVEMHTTIQQLTNSIVSGSTLNGNSGGATDNHNADVDDDIIDIDVDGLPDIPIATATPSTDQIDQPRFSIEALDAPVPSVSMYTRFVSSHAQKKASTESAQNRLVVVTAKRYMPSSKPK